ncbi:MAG: bifunctional riboflavin kinase/FMN adenylyltransferase [Phycisphaeraceae bacterium]
MAVPSVISIGNFDGVHRGHQAIFARARQLADARDAEVVAMTFDPHPASVLRPDGAPPRLTTPPEKQARLQEAGADRVVVLQPTKELLGQPAEQFITRLVDSYRPVAIVERPDFRFGKGRGGDMNLLAELGRSRGFDAVVQPQVELALSDCTLVTVSSSLVRWLVGRGRVLDVGICLGRWHELVAPVMQGEQRGRTIDVPTANLDPAAYGSLIVPADGVYAGEAVLPGGELRPAAISVGVKPTFGQHQLTVEAHVLDFSGDLYGQPLRIRFARWLRDQYMFPNVESLKKQLERDIAHTRELAEQGRLTCCESLAPAS